MDLQEKTIHLLNNNSLCNYCLGRQFSNLATGTTNFIRGESIKIFLAMNFSKTISDDSIDFLQALCKSGSEHAKMVLLKNKIIPKEKEKCFICEDSLQKIDELAENLSLKLNSIEFSTFLIGTVIPKELFEREHNLKAKYEVQQSEYLKQEFNREIGKKLSRKMSVETNFNEPEIIAEIHPFSDSLEVKIRSLYVYGRYLKHLRTIPQTRWPCRKCKGKGCKECGNTGRQYSESVEELVEVEAIKIAQGDKGVLHGSGREDVDARMLGTGRPFVLEIVSPKIRTIDLLKLEKATNEHGIEKIEVRDYRWSSKKELVYLKGNAEESVKKYRASTTLSSPISEEALKKIDSYFKDIVIKQRTPTRVSHRRVDKIREKEVHSIQSKKIDDHEIELIIECEGGCYVKELISGDNNRTIPSVSEVIGIQAICKELDVLEIRDKPFV
ncbi:MAG: tRNA pseudouridine(54/55) synthase Pus10 [Candidatus Heimdallarchaeota archaeon]|nr:tRNA pseudouridine(54/55) synthase Pus10 [Candidatus Heimdallarchaeota archaeon]MCK4769853.1 tRNA pseudouridine(54/55) synthase Pus10 [Candidatus Heimdallarchaeota archaeon]